MTMSDEWRKSPAKKDTKRWCKGVVGRHHVPELVMRNDSYVPRTCGPASEWERRLWKHEWRCYHQHVCSVCGKIMTHTLSPEYCPDNPQSKP